jgi:hypothetical protein
LLNPDYDYNFLAANEEFYGVVVMLHCIDLITFHCEVTIAPVIGRAVFGGAQVYSAVFDREP